MTKIEAAEEIRKQGGKCDRVFCLDCPVCGSGCCFPIDGRLVFVERYLSEHKGANVDNQEAIARLDALDAEAKKLREIIERKDDEPYDSWKLYVAIIKGCPYLLAAYSGRVDYARWHSWDIPDLSKVGWSGNHGTPEAALAYARKDGTLHTFSDRHEGMKFFFDHYK